MRGPSSPPLMPTHPCPSRRILFASCLPRLRREACLSCHRIIAGEVSTSDRSIPKSSTIAKADDHVHPNLRRESQAAPMGPRTLPQRRGACGT